MLDEDTFNNNIEFQGAKGLIFIDGKIIVFRRDTNTNNFPLQVDLPGGGREEGESPFETFKREVHEEFGLDITKEDIVFSKKYESVLDVKKSAYFFVTKPLLVKESNIIFGNEGIEFYLMNPEEYIALPDGVKKQQEKVVEYLKLIESV